MREELGFEKKTFTKKDPRADKRKLLNRQIIYDRIKFLNDIDNGIFRKLNKYTLKKCGKYKINKEIK
jgi:hypothetical protein